MWQDLCYHPLPHCIVLGLLVPSPGEHPCCLTRNEELRQSYELHRARWYTGGLYNYNQEKRKLLSCLIQFALGCTEVRSLGFLETSSYCAADHFSRETIKFHQYTTHPISLSTLRPSGLCGHRQRLHRLLFERQGQPVRRNWQEMWLTPMTL